MLSTEQFKCTKTFNTKDDFFDSELESMRREKNRLYKIAQSSLFTTDSANRWLEYRNFRTIYKNKIQEKQFESNQRKLNRVSGNMKGTWRVLNSILCKENGEITRIKCGATEFDDDIQIANEFNKYFIQSIIEINDSIPTFISMASSNQVETCPSVSVVLQLLRSKAVLRSSRITPTNISSTQRQFLSLVTN